LIILWIVYPRNQTMPALRAYPYALNAGLQLTFSSLVIISSKQTRKLAMSNLEQTKAAILSLPSNEFEKLKQWFFDLDYERWDKQLEQDIAEGKLEAFAQEAISEFEAGHCREI